MIRILKTNLKQTMAYTIWLFLVLKVSRGPQWSNHFCWYLFLRFWLIRKVPYHLDLLKIIENLFEWKLIIWIPYKTFRITFLSSRHIIGNNEYLKPSLSFLFIWKFETKLVMLMRKILPSFLNHPPNIEFWKKHKPWRSP